MCEDAVRMDPQANNCNANAGLLFQHVIWNNSRGVTYLLNKDDTIVNSMSAQSQTPLILAVTCGLISVAKILLAHGANVNLPCSEGGGTHCFDCLVYWFVPVISG